MENNNLQHNAPCGQLGCQICANSTSTGSCHSQQNQSYTGLSYWSYWNQICPTCGRCPTCGKGNQYLGSYQTWTSETIC